MSDAVPTWLTAAVSAFGEACRAQLDGPGEAEAAIRPPLEALLTTVGHHYKLSVIPHGEAALPDLQVRPDYAISVNGAITGYMEVKKPRQVIEPDAFKGRNLLQWKRLQDLPNLLYTNGQSWRLYQNGELVIETTLNGNLYTIGEGLAATDSSFEQLLHRFLNWQPAPIKSVQRLVASVAPLCRLLKAAVLEQLEHEDAVVRAGEPLEDQPFSGLAHKWRQLLFPTADPEEFADGYAQAVTFALLLARTEDIDLANKSLHDIGQKLGAGHALMGTALQLLTDNATDRFQVTLDLLVRVINAVQWQPIRAGSADAYLHLYEKFLSVYDEKKRKKSGTYYTPREVVVEMVRLTEEILKTRLGCTDGYLTDTVVTVDPAMGTGTYLHAIIERAAEQKRILSGAGAVPQAMTALAKRLFGFELQMGPFTVAELRTVDLLKSMKATIPKTGLGLYVTNTLDDPEAGEGELFGPIAKSRRQANKIKSSVPVTVVIGNPPYGNNADGKGAWIEGGNTAKKVSPPLDAFRLNGNGNVEYVLKDLYVYFWRWATLKVFDDPKNQAGVVAFITTDGYLRGPGFKGMRRYLRETCDEGWVISVSPEGMQPDIPTRFFPGVMQRLAIGIFVRRADANPEAPATIHYTEVTGQREEKYAQLAALTLDDSSWRLARTSWEAPFTPAAEGDWDDYPALSELLLWIAPGVKANRTWVYAPAKQILQDRWAKLIATIDPVEKADLLKATRDRTLDKKVQPLPGGHQHQGTISAETSHQVPTPQRVAFRSFDRQWIIPDQRVIDFPRPELWQARQDGQIFISELHSSQISSGPGVVMTHLIPEMHHFKGSEGGRVLPMLHPDNSANVSPKLLALMKNRLGVDVSVQDLVAYIAAVASHSGFTERFADELVTPGIRIPLTIDPDLWQRAVDLGRQVIWASTYGAAFADPQADRPANDIWFPVGDPRRPTMTKAMDEPLPTDKGTLSGDILSFGGAHFAPVSTEVWEYNVGGTQIIKKWISYRKANPGGKKTSPLDEIHVSDWPDAWNTELLELITVLRRLTDLQAEQSELLGKIITSPTFTVADLTEAGILPIPQKARAVRRRMVATLFDDIE